MVILDPAELSVATYHMVSLMVQNAIHALKDSMITQNVTTVIVPRSELKILHPVT